MEEKGMINIVLTGLNGYGGNFIEPLLNSDGIYRLAAVVSRNPKKSSWYERLKEEQVHFYSSLEECLQAEKINMAIITTPMHIHYEEVMCALKYKLAVYCEKPLACTMEQCRQIEAYAKEQGCVAAVGYQWSHSEAITGLKKQILEGKFGKLLKIKTLVLWNRPKSYYAESDWKGRMYGKDGEAVWESVMSNGAAHFLHNLLFLAGEELHKAAYPMEIEEKCYRAHRIETFDTVSVKMKTGGGCELLYLATLVAEKTCAPEFIAECEHAKIYYPIGEKKEIAAELEDGSRLCFGSPEAERFEHFRKVVRTIRGEGTITCDVETALPIAYVIDSVMRRLDVREFPKDRIREDEDILWVEGLENDMRAEYERW